MNDIKRITKNKKGFTLAELLIVVAIIGVLAAISIPIFTSQLEKAREATDAANIRSAYAEISADAITGEEITTAKTEGKITINASSAANGVTTYTATVTLTQKQNGWQSTEPQIGGLKATGEPTVGKTATVTVNSNGTVNTVEYAAN